MIDVSLPWGPMFRDFISVADDLSNSREPAWTFEVSKLPMLMKPGLRCPICRCRIQKGDIDMRVIVYLFKFVWYIVGHEQQCQLCFRIRWKVNSARSSQYMRFFIDVRATGVIARECKWPSTERVVSMAVWVALMISFRPIKGNVGGDVVVRRRISDLESSPVDSRCHFALG